MKTIDSLDAGLRSLLAGAFPPAASLSPHHRHPVLAGFDHLATRVTRWVGSPAAFCIALAMVAVWAMLGPVFGYSEGWQLVINTGTTIVTFLMVFLIQQSQNKDSRAVHLKLDELLAANCEASNRMIGIEDLDEQALRRLAAHYTRLAEKAQAGRRDGAGTDHATGDERVAPAAR
jgi:low affinity Fe/Cu permease